MVALAEWRLRIRRSGFESGYKVFREIIAMLLFTIDVACNVCELKREIKALAQKYFLKKISMVSTWSNFDS
jgi:hypothetical protein